MSYRITRLPGILDDKSVAGWPFANIITVSTTDPDADESDLATAVLNASAGDVLWLDAETFTLAAKLTIDKSLTITADNPENTEITFSGADHAILVTASDVTLYGLTVTNNSTSSAKACIFSNNDNLTVRNCIVNRGGAGTPTIAIGIWKTGGDNCILDNVRVANTVAATSNSDGFRMDTAASSTTIIGGNYAGVDVGITIRRTDATITIQGEPIIDGVVADNHILTTNVSGATVVFGDVGFLDEAGDFDTTTSATPISDAWAIALTESINNAAVLVKRRNNAIVNYTGSAPNAGDFLITSTTAGLALASATMRPEIFAVCTATGAGGKVAVLLLTGTAFSPFTSDNLFYQVALHGGTLFTGTLSANPTGATFPYNIVTGNEAAIKPNAAGQLVKLRIYNSTRAEWALIDSVNTGTNTITVTVAGDLTNWLSGDAFTAKSQTNTAVFSGSNIYFEYEIDLEIPEFARAVAVLAQVRDTASTGRLSAIHPYETLSGGKLITFRNQVVSIFNDVGIPPIPLISKRYTMGSNAGGAATKTDAFKIFGVYVAIP